ncbi:ephrin-A4 [Lepeophtheirus salmonis]|uniref:ephrin-A4 n=1 Tax=Lepeophtheirus salmonis TaxID=72036 RepID=UPI001AE1452F|nr:ephrin-B2-like [Lepeophtheirus salmonis]
MELQYNLLFTLILFLLSPLSSDSTAIHNLYWNVSNPLFSESNEHLTLDVNGGNHPWEYDQVNLICPTYPPSSLPPLESHIIYSVSREEYETCRVTSPSPKIVAVCDRPQEFLYFTITFRSFTPTPGGLEFQPGKDYYFVSTSSREDIQRRIHGYCSSFNMRIIIHVAENSKKLNSSSPEVDRETRQSDGVSDNPIILQTVDQRKLPNVVRKEQRVSSGSGMRSIQTFSTLCLCLSIRLL